MGRFAEMALPLCGRYLGADFAPEMIAAAEKRKLHCISGISGEQRNIKIVFDVF